MLSALQQQLNDIYQVGGEHDVRDYLITDPGLARVIGGGAMRTDSRETLLMSQGDGELSLSLFLDAELLQRLEAADPTIRLRAELLDDLWQVLEGVSHFNCVVWRASRDREVTLLELELQAEVDKFVSTALLALSQRRDDILRRLHGWLFENVSFHPDLDEYGEGRYRAANDYAARFCHALSDRLVEGEHRVLPELRRFFRLPMAEKISHIHSRAWSKT